MHSIITQYYLRSMCDGLEHMEFVKLLPEKTSVENDYTYSTIAISIPDSSLKSVKEMLSKKKIHRPNVYIVNRVAHSVLIIYVLSECVHKGRKGESKAFEKYVGVIDWLLAAIGHNSKALYNDIASAYSFRDRHKKNLIVKAEYPYPYYLSELNKFDDFISGDMPVQLLHMLAEAFSHTDLHGDAWCAYCLEKCKEISAPFTDEYIIRVAEYIERSNAKTRGKDLKGTSVYRLGSHVLTAEERKKGGNNINSQANLALYNNERDIMRGRNMVLCQILKSENIPAKDIVVKLGISKSTYHRLIKDFDDLNDPILLMKACLKDIALTASQPDAYCRGAEKDVVYRYVQMFFENNYEYVINPVFQGVLKALADNCKKDAASYDFDGILGVFDALKYVNADLSEIDLNIVKEHMVQQLGILCRALCSFDDRIDIFRSYFSRAYIVPWVLYMGNDVYGIEELPSIVQEIAFSFCIDIRLFYESDCVHKRYSNISILLEDMASSKSFSASIKKSSLREWKGVYQDNTYLEAAVCAKWLNIPVKQRY